MTCLRAELENASNNGTFLQAVYDRTGLDHDEQALVKVLIQIHNDGSLDVVSEFASLKQKLPDSARFWPMRYIFEQVLPDLMCETASAMTCVLQLLVDAGEDGAAGAVANSLIDFLSKKPTRPEEALKIISNDPDKFSVLLPVAIRAGSTFDVERYCNAVIELLTSSKLELRRQAAFALGRIHWGALTIPSIAVDALERVVRAETDDLVLANALRSATSLVMHEGALDKRIIAVLEEAFKKGGDLTLGSAAMMLNAQTETLGDDILKVLLPNLIRIKPENAGQIDFAISRIIVGSRSEQGIAFLEDYVLSNASVPSERILSTTAYAIRNNLTVLRKVTLRWLLRGEAALCDWLAHALTLPDPGRGELAIDLRDIAPANAKQIIFIARKAIGYLFFRPTIAANILVSLMRQSNDNAVLSELAQLLYERLLLNYGGTVRAYIISVVDCEDGHVKSILSEMLNSFQEYLDCLNAMPEALALHPSVTAIETQRRQFSSTMAKSYRAAESKSPLLSLIKKNVLLYGGKSIDYIFGADGTSRRVETPLQSHRVEIETPRLHVVDPVSLEIALAIFKAERFPS